MYDALANCFFNENNKFIINLDIQIKFKAKLPKNRNKRGKILLQNVIKKLKGFGLYSLSFSHLSM